jgi:hypothetical protein
VIAFNNVDYLMGLALPFHSVPRGWDHIGEVRAFNQNCAVYRDEHGRHYLKVQPINAGWPNLHPLRTQQDLLFGWS